MKQDVRDRLILPLLVPLGLLAVVAIIAAGFGLLLLFNPMTVSLMIASVVAAAILGAFGLASSQSEESLTRAKRAVIALGGVAPIIVGGLVAFDVIETSDEKVVEHEPEFVIGGVEGNVATMSAGDFFFNPETFEFEAPGELEFVMTNVGGIQHTFVIEGVDDFKLDTQAGAEDSGTVELDSGEFVFFCDVPGHRESGMEGSFTVQ